MSKAMTKQQIFWAPSLATAQNIDNSDTVLAIEAKLWFDEKSHGHVDDSYLFLGEIDQEPL